MTEWSNKVIANPARGVAISVSRMELLCFACNDGMEQWQSPFYEWDCFALLAMTEWSSGNLRFMNGIASLCSQ
jgi:hypothetical protein